MADIDRREPIARATLAEFRPLPDERSQYPLEYMETNGVIKLRESDDLVQIGICEPANHRLVEGLAGFHGRPVRFYEIDRSELASYLGGRVSFQEAVGPGDIAGGGADERILLDRLANDAPVVNLVNSIVIDAIRAGASDIHIESFSDEMVVRYRIDGYLRIVKRLDRSRFAAIASRIKIMANLNIMERRLPQDGRITVHLDDDVVDLRASIVPIASGESVVLRLFNTKARPLLLTDLGLAGGDLAGLSETVRKPNGLVLVTGPTGSGKTTTLNAVLQEIRDERLKIITIEDPVEYVCDGVDQIQTNDRIGLTFESILRRILRQDPDVIMVGEIRDTPTAQLAIRSALTGHLVFSTLHTQDAVSVIPRLVNMGIEPYLLAAVLRCSVAQRLVRRLCPECRKTMRPKAAQKALLDQCGLKSGRVFGAVGCDECHGTGYRGRVGVFEVVVMDDRLEDMAARAAPISEVREYLQTTGARSMMLDGLEKALAGSTTLEEVERAAAF